MVKPCGQIARNADLHAILLDVVFPLDESQVVVARAKKTDASRRRVFSARQIGHAENLNIILASAQNDTHTILVLQHLIQQVRQ